MNVSRIEQSFDDSWEFALTDTEDFPTGNTVFHDVCLPHDWSAAYPVAEDAPSCGSGGYARTGIGWYRKRFVWHPEGREACLLFGGVYMNCDLWVNGTPAAHHAYGYTSFEVAVTPFLQDGENILLIRVDNSHQPNSRWYSGSGITRGVLWIERKPTHIPTWGVQVLTSVRENGAQVRVQTEIVNPALETGLTLRTRVLGPDGRVAAETENPVLPGDFRVLRQEALLPHPILWDVTQPALYTAEITLCREAETVDTTAVRFGIRSIEYSAEQGFLLNGRKVLLKGVCLHHDGGCVGAAVPPEIWERRLRKLQDMGCNAIRFSHNPPDQALLNLADQMGFLVMEEAFDEWQELKSKEAGSNTHESRGYSECFDSCWKEDIASMIRRDRNHPSIIMWSAGNEIGEQTTEDGVRILKELAGLCHALDPSRPVTAACDQVKAEPYPAKEDFLQETDLVGVNYADRWRERTETFFMEEKLEHPEWKLLGTEDIAVNGIRGDYRLETEESVWGRTPYYARMLKAEKLWKFLRTRPFMIGSFMWTGIDYLGECFWPRKASSAGVLDTCGFEKDGFWFYRSLWREDETTLFAAPFPDPEVYGQGRVIPVIVYTNAFCAELFVGDRSYGMKAYEFPGQGMTRHWAHFDRKQAPITTNDLHLAWDVPCTGEPVTVVGYDMDGKEIARQVMREPEKAAAITAEADRESVAPGGVVQLEIALTDQNGNIVTGQDVAVTVSTEGGALLGLDNGNPEDHTLYQTPTRNTFRGRGLAIIRAGEHSSGLRIILAADGLAETEVNVPALSSSVVKMPDSP